MSKQATLDCENKENASTILSSYVSKTYQLTIMQEFDVTQMAVQLEPDFRHYLKFNNFTVLVTSNTRYYMHIMIPFYFTDYTVLVGLLRQHRQQVICSITKHYSESWVCAAFHHFRASASVKGGEKY